MTDILIRDVPAEAIAAVEANAKRMGLSRNEYLRRQLIREATHTTEKLTMQELRRFAETVSDLDDPEVMAKAWQ
ncbi:MAG: type II toxin-antitoxin system VapB family antitoxin [Pseudonocardiaceae bacterium]